MYQALYRKWRPSTFAHVVGQEHITSILTSEVENGKISHAYLFCGPRGTGKTTCAKIIAKAANCEHPENGNPCGKCDACLAIEAGTTTDIVEMDAASNNGVDNIRDLRDGVVYTPADLKYRVYIIDEVHMLSISAFNALLKTLEEPPEHVIFILATTELHKIPATVLSRCQRFDFHRVSMGAIVNRLSEVCAGEGINAETEALSLIAGLSQGGMRDALNMLEYCAGDGGEITSEKAERLLGAASKTLLARLLGAVAERDIVTALSVIEEIYMSSRDIAVFWREMITFCRDILIAISTRTAHTKDDHIRAICEKFRLSGLLYVLEIFMAAEADMQKNPAGARLYAEMALIRATDNTLSDSNAALIDRISALEDKIASGNFTVTAPVYTASSMPSPTAELTTVTNKNAEMPSAAPSVETPKAENTTSNEGQRKLKGFKKWPEVIRKLASTEGLFVPFLQSAYAYEGSDGKFYLFFENSFAVTLLSEDRKQKLCNAINAAGGRYTPLDIIGTVREDGGEIRNPIDDLTELEEAEVQ